MYVDALPGRLSAIAPGTRSGDTLAVVSAAHTLAGTSGQLGHPEVASSAGRSPPTPAAASWPTPGWSSSRRSPAPSEPYHDTPTHRHRPRTEDRDAAPPSDGPSGDGPGRRPARLDRARRRRLRSPPAHRITTLLQLGGWQVHRGGRHRGRPAPGRASIEPDLVVTGHGHAERARGDPHAPAPRAGLPRPASSWWPHAARTRHVRAWPSGAGALACLAKPVDPRLFVDVMRGLAPAGGSGIATGRPRAAVPRSRRGPARRGDVPERAAAPAVGDRRQRPGGRRRQPSRWPRRLLAAASDRLGHAEVAFVSSAVARGRPSRGGHARTAGEAGGALLASSAGPALAAAHRASAGSGGALRPDCAPVRSSLAASLRCSRSCRQATQR